MSDDTTQDDKLDAITTTLNDMIEAEHESLGIHLSNYATADARNSATALSTLLAVRAAIEDIR